MQLGMRCEDRVNELAQLSQSSISVPVDQAHVTQRPHNVKLYLLLFTMLPVFVYVYARICICM
jgi:hypothetical protein